MFDSFYSKFRDEIENDSILVEYNRLMMLSSSWEDFIKEISALIRNKFLSYVRSYFLNLQKKLESSRRSWNFDTLTKKYFMLWELSRYYDIKNFIKAWDIPNIYSQRLRRWELLKLLLNNDKIYILA